MKRYLLAPALAALLLTSCKDDAKLEAPQIDSIALSKERVALGQLIILTPSVTDKDTNPTNLIYRWQSTDGFSSDEEKAEWVPTALGEQVITLTVDDGTTRATKEAKVEVLEPDFRLGLWGDSQKDITMSEKHVGSELIDANDNVLVYPGGENIAADVYYFTDKKLDEAATFYFPEYSETELDRYITDFEARKSDLAAIYGAPIRDIAQWVSEEAKAKYTADQRAQAIAAGDLFLASLWSKTEKTNMALILQDDGEGGMIIILAYFPVEDGGRYASNRQVKINPLSKDEIRKIRALLN